MPQRVTSIDNLEVVGSIVQNLNDLMIQPIDMSAYAWWSLAIVGNNHVGQLSWEGSNDKFVNQIVGMYAYQQNVPSAYFQNDTNVGNSVHIFHGPRTSRWFRVRQNAYTSGSATGVLELWSTPSFAGAINAIQTGNWLVSMIGPSTNGVQAANTAGANVVKGSPGYLWSAMVSVLGTAELDIYDNAAAASGTKLLSIPASAPVGSIYSFQGGARANNGITSGGVLNCPGVTFQFS